MTPPQPDRSPSRRLAVVDLAGIGLAAVTLAGFAGGWHWLLDLTSHFRWYWLLAAVVGLALAAGRRRRLAAGVLAVVIAVNAWAILPYWLPGDGDGDGGAPLEIVSLNVFADNVAKDRTLAYLRRREADLVVLLEVDTPWAEALAELESLYPHRVIEPRDDNFGLAVLSRLPLESPRVEELADGPPVIVAGVRLGERSCLLVAAHPPAPISAGWSARRDAQLAAIGKLAAAESRPVIVAGDLNATPWSHGFRQLLAPGALRDSARGRGLQATWNARHVVPRIPIDHVLVSPAVRVESRRIGPDVGSDHLPVEATLIVPPAKEPRASCPRNPPITRSRIRRAIRRRERHRVG
jgi:endonuclease/exonuclease/phosphatase (EEP) superfamily protein YafD